MVELLPMVAAVIGWVLAGIFGGLWWGERGRRRDLGWLLGAMRPPDAGAKPGPEVERIPVIEEERLEELEAEELTAQLLDEARLSGQAITEDQAVAEAKRILQELYSPAGLR